MGGDKIVFYVIEMNSVINKTNYTAGPATRDESSAEGTSTLWLGG